MNDIKSDVLEVIGSSRYPLSHEDVLCDVRIWPLHRGEPMRTDVTAKEVATAITKLVAEGKVEEFGDGYRVRRAVPKEDKQLSLF